MGGGRMGVIDELERKSKVWHGTWRRKVVLVYIVLTLLAVPVWWRTTEIYRAPLPVCLYLRCVPPSSLVISPFLHSKQTQCSVYIYGCMCMSSSRTPRSSTSSMPPAPLECPLSTSSLSFPVRSPKRSASMKLGPSRTGSAPPSRRCTSPTTVSWSPCSGPQPSTSVPFPNPHNPTIPPTPFHP